MIDTVSPDSIGKVINNEDTHKVNGLPFNRDSINYINQVGFTSSVDIVIQVKQGKGNSCMGQVEFTKQTKISVSIKQQHAVFGFLPISI